MDNRTSQISEAFELARSFERERRDQKIDQDLDRLDRLADTITPGPPAPGSG